MKKILIVLMLILFAGCETKPFTGYVVCKEYTPLHMSNKQAKTIQMAIVIVPPRPVPHRSKPHLVKSKWSLYVANKTGVRVFNVDSLYFTRVKCGQPITMK